MSARPWGPRLRRAGEPGDGYRLTAGPHTHRRNQIGYLLARWPWRSCVETRPAPSSRHWSSITSRACPRAGSGISAKGLESTSTAGDVHREAGPEKPEKDDATTSSPAGWLVADARRRRAVPRPTRAAGGPSRGRRAPPAGRPEADGSAPWRPSPAAPGTEPVRRQEAGPGSRWRGRPRPGPALRRRPARARAAGAAGPVRRRRRRRTRSPMEL